MSKMRPRIHVPRPLLGCLVIGLAALLCSSSAFLVVDRICAAYLPQRLPIYPGAQTIFQSHNFLTPYGMGVTVITLVSSDPPDKVRTWYGETTGTFQRENANTGNPIIYMGSRFARVQYDVSESEDGTGSQIILYAKCVN